MMGSDKSQNQEPAARSDQSRADESEKVVESHDPTGIDLALRVAHEVAGMLPPPRVGKKRRKTATQLFQEQRSGARADERDPQPLGKAVARLIGRRGWKTQLGVRSLLDRWPELVGPAVAEHCTPTGFSDGVVYVKASSTTWATALRTLAPSVVASLNAQLGHGTVSRIQISGPAAPSWKHGPKSVRDAQGPRDTYG